MALPFVFVSVPEHLVPVELLLTIATSLVLAAPVIVVGTAVILAFLGMARAVVAAVVPVPIWQNAGTQADPLRALLGIINEAFIARLPAHFDWYPLSLRPSFATRRPFWSQAATNLTSLGCHSDFSSPIRITAERRIAANVQRRTDLDRIHRH